MLLFLGFTTVLLLNAQSLQVYATRVHCQPVPNFCRNLTSSGSYNLMRLPNALNGDNVDDIVKGIGDWNLLVGHCHPGLKLFLCAIYAPICLEGFRLNPISICKSFCFNVKTRCEPVMKRSNYSWPGHEAFNCSRYEDNDFCVREEYSYGPTEPPTTRATTPGYPRKEDICDPLLYRDDVLLNKARSSDLVFIRAYVTDVRAAKGDNSYILLRVKIKRHGRKTSRKSRKGKDCHGPDRVLVPKYSCGSLPKIIQLIEQKKLQSYLIVLETRSGKKTKYIAKVILPWRNKKFRRLIKKNPCRLN